MNNIVVRSIERAKASIIQGLGEQGTATVHEAQNRMGLMLPYMRPVFSGVRVSGSAVTALTHPGDNWMLHVIPEIAQEGDMATSYKAQGILGLIIDAGCRDSQELTAMKFPVWSRAISAKGTVKKTLGSVNIPVICAGALVNPGDVIVADDDGVVVVPRERAAEVYDAGLQREENESQKRSRLAAGELGLDISNMRSALKNAGLVYVETLNEYD